MTDHVYLSVDSGSGYHSDQCYQSAFCETALALDAAVNLNSLQ